MLHSMMLKTWRLFFALTTFSHALVLLLSVKAEPQYALAEEVAVVDLCASAWPEPRHISRSPSDTVYFGSSARSAPECTLRLPSVPVLFDACA